MHILKYQIPPSTELGVCKLDYQSAVPPTKRKKKKLFHI